jgi:hypothetical protein
MTNIKIWFFQDSRFSYVSGCQTQEELEETPIKEFLLEVIKMDELPSGERILELHEQYKFINDKAQVKKLLDTILAARHYAIAVLHKTPPENIGQQLSPEFDSRQYY